jgi:hypothetical protein
MTKENEREEALDALANLGESINATVEDDSGSHLFASIKGAINYMECNRDLDCRLAITNSTVTISDCIEFPEYTTIMMCQITLKGDGCLKLKDSSIIAHNMITKVGGPGTPAVWFTSSQNTKSTQVYGNTITYTEPPS